MYSTPGDQGCSNHRRKVIDYTFVLINTQVQLPITPQKTITTNVMLCKECQKSRLPVPCSLFNCSSHIVCSTTWPDNQTSLILISSG